MSRLRTPEPSFSPDSVVPQAEQTESDQLYKLRVDGSDEVMTALDFERSGRFLVRSGDIVWLSVSVHHDRLGETSFIYTKGANPHGRMHVPMRRNWVRLESRDVQATLLRSNFMLASTTSPPSLKESDGVRLPFTVGASHPSLSTLLTFDQASWEEARSELAE